MYTAPPSLPQTQSPASNGRWKRGRPVTSRSSIVRPIHNSLSTCGEAAILRPAESSQNQAVEAPAAEGSQHRRSPNSPKPLYSAPAQRLDDGPPTFATTNLRLESQTIVNEEGTVTKISMDTRTKNKVRFVTALTPEDAGDPSSTAQKRSARTAITSKTIIRKTPSDSDDDIDGNYQDESRRDSDTDNAQQDTNEEHVPLVSFVPLAYQIPHNVFKTTAQATPNTRASYYSTSLYRGPQGETVSVHYCSTMEVANRVAQHFLKEEVVGFDIEWKPWCNPHSIKKNASLIQLACEKRIALFHIARFPGTKLEKLMPPNLKTVLESPNITKVGVAIKGDFTRLEKYLGIRPQGVFELSRLHNLVEWYETNPAKVSNKLVGLAAQVLQHLRLPLYKGKPLEDEPEVTSSVRESDWSKPLDLQQIHYAAADAYAGFRLYHVLEWKRKQLRPIPSPIQLCDYDSKPTPRSKEPRKRAKSTAKSKIVPENDIEPNLMTQEQESESNEDFQDSEGYETAPEEILNSHQLEDPGQPSLSNASEVINESFHHAALKLIQNLNLQNDVDYEGTSAYRQTGKINTSWLSGPDPGYPILPQEPREIPSRPYSHPICAKDDEFEDPELDETLNNLELDSDGELRDVENEDKFIHSPTTEAQLPQAPPSNQGAQGDTNAKSIPLSPLPTLRLDTAHSLQYADATTWAQTYLQSTIPPATSKSPARIRATNSHLRAFHMWAYQKLSVDDIAKHLRDPPLAVSTVTGYIAQAISLERLDYDQEALKDVMTAMPLALRQGRWKQLSEQVEALQ